MKSHYHEMKKTKAIGKGVSTMKKICAFIFAVAVAVVTPAVLFAAASGDNSYGTVTDYQQVIKVHNEFNAYGIAIKGTTTSTTTTTTTNSKGEKSTTVETVTTESSWHAGSLKPDTSHTVSDTKSSDGSTQHSDFTDTYTYDNNGKLTGASGTGTTTSYDGETKHTTSGTITRSFIIKDGQALFTKQVTSGTTKDKDGKEIGTFSSTTTIAESDYKYLGGSWVPMKQVSTSTSTDKAGNSETITRTTTYNRDANGTITGMSQTATGTKVEITSDKSKKTYTLTDYSVTVKNDPRMGYYIASEDYSWKLN